MKQMKMPPLSANKIMIIIGGTLVFLMVLSAGVSTAKRMGFARKCHDGNLDICTALINSKQMPEKERGQYYAIRGYYLDQKGEYDQAIADYGNAISRVSPQPALYANRAAAYAKKGRYDEAVRDYSLAVNLVPANTAPGLYCARADAEYHKGDALHGDADLAQAKKIAPQAACIAKVAQPANPAPPAPGPAGANPGP
jgi:tetratricopeptide (TPR) repeat protein